MTSMSSRSNVPGSAISGESCDNVASSIESDRKAPSPGNPASSPLWSERYLHRRGDRDSAARLLAERDADAPLLELESLGDLVADLDGQRLAERALVAESRQVDLQRLRLEAERHGLVHDRRRVEVGLVRDRADGGELVADELDALDAGVLERLEPRVRLAACVAEGDELLLHEV